MADLYRANSQYHFTNGFSIVAIFALVVAVLPNLPGFLVRLYDYAWFVGFAIAFVVYLGLRTLHLEKTTRST